MRLFCARCGADADAEDAEFLLATAALPPEAGLPLLETHCESCATTTDAVLWPSEPGAVARALAEAGEPEPGTVALLGRYATVVDGFAERVRAQHAAWAGTEDVGLCMTQLDLEGLDLERLLAPPVERPLAVPAVALAAVRGARRAVEAERDAALHVRIRIGHLTCVLPLDPGPLLHLSVSSVGATTPSPVEQHLALALCFESSERLRLTGQPGQILPVVHFYLAPLPAD